MTVQRHIPSEACEANCFACKLSSIHFSGAATPTRTPEIAQKMQFEKEMTRDNAAYRRLRKEGYQPKAVKGAANVEQFATSKFEIESGHRLSSAKVGRKYDETQAYLTTGGGLKPIGASAQ